MSKFCHLHSAEPVFLHTMYRILCKITIGSLLFTYSCNDQHAGSATETNKEKVTDSREKELRDDIAKYPDSAVLKENLFQYYRDNDNYDMAIGEVNKALQKDSNNARLWDIKATLYYENEDTLESIKSFEKAVNISPRPEYVISLATFYALTRNPKALDYSGVLQLADKARAKQQALFIKGLYYSSCGDKKRSIPFFDAALAENYTFMEAYLEKGKALTDLGNYPEAINTFTKAVTVQNNFEEGYYRRGYCYEKMNKKEEAIADYRTTLTYMPEFVEAEEGLKRLGVAQ